MSKSFILFSLISYIGVLFVGCNHTTKQEMTTTEDTLMEYPTVCTYLNPESEIQIDSANSIILNDTYLFNLFKHGFEQFNLPVQVSGYYGFFPEIFNGKLQRLNNKCDTLPYNLENDTIYWENIYENTGDLFSLICNSQELRSYHFHYPLWLHIFDRDVFFEEDNENEEHYFSLINNKTKLNKILKEEFEYTPYRSLIGMMILKNGRIVEIDTAYYGFLSPEVNGGKDGSFFEIPDSIFELYCKKPQ